MLAGCTQPSATAAPSTSRINTPSAWSKPQHDAVHRKGRTPAVGAKTAYIAPGSPWENGYVESFNARLRDELLDGEIFYTLREAQIVIESWRRHYNAVRPHCSPRLQGTG